MTLIERAHELSAAAERLAARKSAAADASALGEALETFERQRAVCEPAKRRVHAIRAVGLSVTLPTTGADIAAELLALASRIDADPTAVRDRRAVVDRVASFVEVVARDVETVLSEYVARVRGGADRGLVRTLRAIGLDDAAESVEAALKTLERYEAQLPSTREDLETVDAAGVRIRQVLGELEDPDCARLVDFMSAVASGLYGLDHLDAALLEQLKTSGAAANFVIGYRRQQ